MAKSIYDLAVDYIELYIMPKEINNRIKNQILRDLKETLARGYTDTEILDILNDYVEDNPSHIPLIPNLFNGKPKQRNLLSPDKFYYHPQLRVMPGVPKKHWDQDTGEITTIEEYYFLELRASYTLLDLYKYYLRQMGLTDSEYARARMLGGLKWLLKQHSVDLVLFMIDIGGNLKDEETDKGYFEPVELNNYDREALENMGAKITEERGAGNDHVVPRKRVLSNRSRS